MPTLTLSGNEITDASRALGVQGDGLLNDSSHGIWEPTMNLVTNGGFETNTTGWTTGGTNTIAVSAEQAKFGAKSKKFTYQDNNLASQFVITLTAAKHVATAWVYVPTAYDGTVITFRFSGFVGATATAGSVNANLTLRDQWQRLSIDQTPDAGDLAGSLQFVVTGGVPTAGGVFYIDGVQIELQPIATPYVETDGGTAARSAARVQAPVSLIDETQGWAAFRVRMGWVNTADPSGNPVLLDWKDDANNLLQLRFDTTGNTWELQRRNTANTGEVTKADTFALSDMVTVIAAWDASNLKVSVDGSAFTSAAAANIPTLTAATFDIGSVAGTSEHIDSDILWAAFGTGTLTDADATTIHAFGNTDPTIGALPGDPTAVWPADTSTYTVQAGGGQPAGIMLRRTSRYGYGYNYR